MKINRNVILAIGVAAIGFAAGRFITAGESTAVAQDPGQEMPADVAAMIEAGAPGEHHAYLDQLMGRWDAVFTMWSGPGEPAVEMAGTIERSWVLDGHYLQEHVEAVTDMGTFNGIGYIGYNNIDGQYEVVWMDSMSSAIMRGTGSYDATAKIMSFRTTMRDPLSGRVIHTRSTVDVADENRHVYKEYATGADGREYKSFAGVSERAR